MSSVTLGVLFVSPTVGLILWSFIQSDHKADVIAEVMVIIFLCALLGTLVFGVSLIAEGL